MFGRIIDALLKWTKRPSGKDEPAKRVPQPLPYVQILAIADLHFFSILKKFNIVIFPAYAGVSPAGVNSGIPSEDIPRICGGEPLLEAVSEALRVIFPA